MGKTKAEEREALAKIGQILEDFSPEDTYVGKAFEGCIEQAEENLRYDGMISWKAEYESKNREVARLTEKLAEVNKRLRESEVARVDLTKELSQKDDTIARLEEVTDKLHESEEHRVDLTKELNQKDDAIARLTDANEQFSKEIDQKDAECMDLRGKVWEAEALIRDLRQTIIELKAKLYDMMTREEVSG